MVTRPQPYRAACLQLELLGPVATPEQGAAYRERAVARLDEVIGAVRRPRRQAPLRLVLVPEFWLCGGQRTESIEDYRAAAAVTVPGPLTDELGRVAVRHGCHIATNVVEVDGDVLYDSAVVVGEDGSILLHYREIAAAAHGASMAAPPLEVDGDDPTATITRAMPVADTPLGRLAVLVGSDVRYGTIAELAALRGADVVLHLANEPELCRDVWMLSKSVRSREGRHYLLSCNNAGHQDPLASVGQTSWGGSRILAPTGRVLVETLATGEAVVESTIDLALVDAVRERCGIARARAPIAPSAGPVGAEAAAPPRPSACLVTESEGSAAEVVWELDDGLTAHVTIADRADADGAHHRLVVTDGSDAARHPIDVGAPVAVSLVGLVVDADGRPSAPTARLPLGEGADAARRVVVDGARALVVVTDGPLRPAAANDLRDWARVVAWENEVPVMVLGELLRRPGSPRLARELTHISPLGDVLEVVELDERTWRGLPVTPTADPVLHAQLRQRRRVRRTLADLVEAYRLHEHHEEDDRP